MTARPFRSLGDENLLSRLCDVGDRSRAIPDLRDGLKPVHRRILYAMHEAATPTTNLPQVRPSVGDVMGKYHPHGDSAIYDALVRMAQDFSMSLPLA